MSFANHLVALTVILGAPTFVGTAFGTEITATITGTVASGDDISGVFGPANSSLAGQNFTLTFAFDDSKGVQNTALNNGKPDFSSITSTSSSNPGTATLDIGSGSFTFGVVNAAQLADSEFARYAPPADSEVYLLAGDGHYGRGSGIAGYVYPATDTILTPDYYWEDSFSDSNLDNIASLSFEISELGFTNQYVVNGQLTPHTITVVGLTPGTAPEPKSYLLLGVGLAALGLMTRRSRGSARSRSGQL